MRFLDHLKVRVKLLGGFGLMAGPAASGRTGWLAAVGVVNRQLQALYAEHVLPVQDLGAAGRRWTACARIPTLTYCLPAGAVR